MVAPARLACTLPAIAALVAASAAVAQPIATDASHPKRRAGLWEMRSTNAEALGMPPTRFCVGDQTDSHAVHLDRSAGPRGSCSLGRFERDGSSWVAESVCREGRSVVTSRAVASGDFDAEYRIDTVVTHPATGSSARREDREAVVARWLGACDPGQRPGDLVVPGMGTLNMNDGTFRAEPSRGRRAGAPTRPPAPASAPPR